MFRVVNPKERNIQRDCLDNLRKCGWSVWKLNTTGIYVKKYDRWITNPSAGIADAIAIKRGKTLMLEFKARYRKQSPKQIEFQKEWEKRGGTYLLIKSIKDYEQYLR